MLPDLLLLAFVGLPGVLGNCCMPEKFFSIRVNIATGLRSRQFVDFKKQKVLILPPKSYDVEFFLKDIGQRKTYIKYRNGKCQIVQLDRITVFPRCIPNTAKQGTNRLFGLPGQKMVTQVWDYKHYNSQVKMIVSQSKCIPVVWIFKYKYGKGFTATTPISFYNTIVMYDSDEYFDKDLSNCVKKQSTVG